MILFIEAPLGLSSWPSQLPGKAASSSRPRVGALKYLIYVYMHIKDMYMYVYITYLHIYISYVNMV